MISVSWRYGDARVSVMASIYIYFRGDVEVSITEHLIGRQRTYLSMVLVWNMILVLGPMKV